MSLGWSGGNACICDMPRSNTGCVITILTGVFMIFLTPYGQTARQRLAYAMKASCQILFKSQFINHPTIRRYMVRISDSVVK
jgi:hypothetical protein